MTAFFALSILLAGCQQPPAKNIPGIPAGHPAQDFYRFVSQNMVSDNVCRDHQGDPGIPIGKIEAGEGYAKDAELTPGVFRFRDTATGKSYFGVSFLQYNGMLQIPKVCVWEEK